MGEAALATRADEGDSGKRTVTVGLRLSINPVVCTRLLVSMRLGLELDLFRPLHSGRQTSSMSAAKKRVAVRRPGETRSRWYRSRDQSIPLIPKRYRTMTPMTARRHLTVRRHSRDTPFTL